MAVKNTNPFVIRNAVKNVIAAKKENNIRIPGRDFINLSSLGPDKAFVVNDGNSDILSFKQSFIDIYTEDNGKPRQLLPAGLHKLNGPIPDCRWESINYSPDDSFLWNLFLAKSLDRNLDIIYRRLFKLQNGQGKTVKRSYEPEIYKEHVKEGLGILNMREKAEIDTSLKAITNSGSNIFSARELGILLNDLDDNDHGRFVLLFSSGKQVFGISFYVKEF